MIFIDLKNNIVSLPNLTRKFMIRFKDIRTADKDLIQRFTIWNERQNCDLSFANLISWRFLYNTQFAIVDDYLVFRFYAGHHLAYMMPIPKPKQQEDGSFKVEPCDECSLKVIDAMRDDSLSMGHPFLMMGVCNYMVDIIEGKFPDRFVFEPDRDRSDYIYEREKLIHLSGKKLQSKRNHINKFKSLYPGYEYKELTKEFIPQCIELERQWRKISKDDADTEDLDEGLSEELRSMTRAFNRWEELDLRGGTIWVDGKLVAFTFGCPINHNTFDVCVEKADVNYEGSFTIINQEFVKHLPEHYYYINREEDMGDEGLRRAKLSYRPDILLEKNVVKEKHPLALFTNPSRVKEETMQLWRKVFKDPESFVQLYFSRVYRDEYNVIIQLENRVVAALQTLPYTMLWKEQEINTVYISGVSVDEEYRKQDIGSNLMRQAHFAAFHQRKAVFATLIPAEEWLYGWYAKQGYAKVMTCTPPPARIRKMDYEIFDALQREKECILLQDVDRYTVIQEDLRLTEDRNEPARQPIPAMLRVINAEAALDIYARLHPEKMERIRVKSDDDIPDNNAYYIIDHGAVKQTDEPDAGARIFTIAELAQFLFDGVKAEMWLMLN